MNDVQPLARMTRLSRRARFVASCYGKHPFTSAALARKVARKSKGERRVAYRCGECGKWHVGTPPPRTPRLKDSNRGAQRPSG